MRRLLRSSMVNQSAKRVFFSRFVMRIHLLRRTSSALLLSVDNSEPMSTMSAPTAALRKFLLFLHQCPLPLCLLSVLEPPCSLVTSLHLDQAVVRGSAKLLGAGKKILQSLPFFHQTDLSFSYASSVSGFKDLDRHQVKVSLTEPSPNKVKKER